MIRVMHVVTSLHIGGTERQVVALTRGMNRRSFELHVACLRRAGPFLEEIEAQGIPLTEYPIPSLLGARSLRERWRLARELRRQRIDVVHCWGFYANLFGVPAARLARARVVLASIRDLGDLLWTDRQRRAQRLVARLCDRVVVNAQAVADHLIRSGYDAARLVVIPNGIDTAPFARTPDAGWRGRNGVSPSALLVTVVARLDRARGVDFKGIGHFLQAARVLAARFADVRFLIVGDGTHRQALEAQARGHGLDGRVMFMGFRRDVPEVLAQTSVLVQPSLTEALSNSILEAMAAAVPVVATRVGGNPELIEDGSNGMLVPPADPASLARALARLLESAELRQRLGRAARERVAARFSVERLARATEECYTTSLGRARWPRRSASPEPAAAPGAGR